MLSISSRSSLDSFRVFLLLHNRLQKCQVLLMCPFVLTKPFWLCLLFVLFSFVISHPYWALNPSILPLIEVILHPEMSAFPFCAVFSSRIGYFLIKTSQRQGLSFRGLISMDTLSSFQSLAPFPLLFLSFFSLVVSIPSAIL